MGRLLLSKNRKELIEDGWEIHKTKYGLWDISPPESYGFQGTAQYTSYDSAVCEVKRRVSSNFSVLVHYEGR